MIDDLSRELSTLGHQVLVATSSVGADLLDLPYEVVVVDRNDPTEALSRVREFVPDVIHVHNYLDNSPVLLNTLNLQARVILTFHNEHKSLSDGPARARFEWVKQNVDGIVAVSDFVKRSVCESGDFGSVPVTRIWNGSHPRSGETEIGSGVLFMGRIVSEKGLGSLLAAMVLLIQKHEDVKLNVVGEGEMRALFEKLANDLGLAENVTFLGWQTGSKLEELIHASRVIVVPSAWREPLGLVAIEGMMNSRPVIVTDRGGLPEIIEDKIQGFVVQPGDVIELAVRLSQLVSNKPLAEEMGRAGYARAMSHFNLSHTARSYLEIYQG